MADDDSSVPVSASESAPLVEFFSLYPDAPSPDSASRDIRGSLPSRAVKVCTPITSASGFGWYLYPPVDFALRWDGSETVWSLLEGNEPVKWRSLAGGRGQALPEAGKAFADLPEERAKDLGVFERTGGVPPFIDADPRGPERVEIVTGMLARTRPGWLLQLGEVANWPRNEGVQIYEGLVECEWYRAYIPTILRLTTPNKVVRFYRHIPMVMARAIPASVVEANRSVAPVINGIADLPDDVWGEFLAWRRDRQNPDIQATYLQRQRDRARQAAGRTPQPADELA